jgi:hypothetical protein
LLSFDGYFLALGISKFQANLDFLMLSASYRQALAASVKKADTFVVLMLAL